MSCHRPLELTGACAQFWGWNAAFKAGGMVVGTPNDQNLATGHVINVGFVIQQAADDGFNPTSIQVNGHTCY
jgi:hypothetical protein